MYRHRGNSFDSLTMTNVATKISYLNKPKTAKKVITGKRQGSRLGLIVPRKSGN